MRHYNYKKVKWTPENKQYLRDCVQKGLTVKQTAALFACSDVAIRIQKYKMDLSNSHWTAKDNRQLRKLTASRTPVKKISKLMGRTPGAIYQKRYMQKGTQV